MSLYFQRLIYCVMLCLLSFMLHIPVLYAGDHLSAQKQVSVIQQTRNKLDTLITGKWRQVKFRFDRPPNQEYFIDTDTDSLYVDKVYGSGYFSVFVYNDKGQAYVAYGGRYEILNDDTIRETIEFYAPYDRILLRPGTNGQMALIRIESMVSAQAELTITFEEGQMYQIGHIIQNAEGFSQAESYGDIWLDTVFKKVPNTSYK